MREAYAVGVVAVADVEPVELDDLGCHGYRSPMKTILCQKSRDWAKRVTELVPSLTCFFSAFQGSKSLSGHAECSLCPFVRGGIISCATWKSGHWNSGTAGELGRDDFEQMAHIVECARYHVDSVLVRLRRHDPCAIGGRRAAPERDRRTSHSDLLSL
jgi:hypothetical protein